MKYYHQKFVLFFALGLLLFAANSAKAENIDKSQIQQKLAIIFGGIEADKITLVESEVKGFYIMRYAGEYGLVSKDGQHYLSGDAWNIDKGQNLTDELRKAYNLGALGKLNPNTPVSFKAKNQKSSIWVFTDIDCFYCRKLHSEMTELNDLGVTVNYLAFPRSGSKTGGDWHKAIDVWCSKDQQSAMTASKQGKSISNLPKVPNCSVDIAKQYNTGRTLGVRGTPAIVLANGKLISGYLPAKALAKEALANRGSD